MDAIPSKSPGLICDRIENLGSKYGGYAVPILAASPLKLPVQSAPDPVGHPVVTLIENPLLGLPEPVGLSLIILGAMLLALAGLHLLASNPQPQNSVSDGAKPQVATDATSGPGQTPVPNCRIKPAAARKYSFASRRHNSCRIELNMTTREAIDP